MGRFRYVLLPALVAACQNQPGTTSATSGTDSTTGTTSDSTTATTSDSTNSSETTIDTPTTGGPGTMSIGSESEGSATMATSETTVDPTTVGPTTNDTTTEVTTGETTAVDPSNGPDGTDTGVPGECGPGDTQDCYSGPPDTLGVGLCAAGQQTCGPDETWGPCDGEVLPAAESCEIEGDEDCDGVDPCDSDGAQAWSLVAGGEKNDEGVHVAYDGAGNLVLAAWSAGPIDLGGGPLAPKGGSDVLLAKFSPTGQHLWSKRFGDANLQDVWRVVVGPVGEIVLTGDFNGSIDFGGGPLTNNENTEDTYLVKFTGDGEHVWSKSFDSAPGSVHTGGVAVDASGNVLLGGRFVGPLDLGGGVMNAAGLSDAFVSKFTSSGAHVWSLRFGDGMQQYVTALAADATGNVYVAGGFQGVINPGNGQLASAGAEDVFLARFDSGGNAMWAKRFGNGASQIGRGLAIGGGGRVTLVGEMSGSADFGGGPLMTAQVFGFAAQFESDGSHRWSKMLGQAGGALPLNVATDGTGNVLVTGNFTNMCDFGGGPLVSDGGSDAFLLKLAPSGDHVWSKHFGDDADQGGLGVAGSAAGDVAFSGRFQGGINLGDGPKTSKGGWDLFVAAFEP
ncbi:nucleotide-binding protein [Nannocystis pusilla]|uniref:nucleotide-binding protein n=1 Tax=Nannocystis pusilla TaxID=889268 RepID=UPI003BEF80A9